jgi:SAM-dependent methyltransferase
MIDKPEINGYVKREVAALTRSASVNSGEVRHLFMMFRHLFRKWDGTVSDMSSLYDLCAHFDKEEGDTENDALSDRIENEQMDQTVGRVRHSIGADILRSVFRNRSHAVPFGDIDVAMQLERSKDLHLAVWDLVGCLHKDDPETFNPTWIQTRSSNLHCRLADLVKDTKTRGLYHWDEVKVLLPEKFKDRFVIDSILPTEEKVARAVAAHEKVARLLGQDALAQFLISSGQVGNLDFDGVIRVITKHLGVCSVDSFDIEDLKELPPAVLHLSAVSDVIFYQIRRFIYRKLLASLPEDSGPDQFGILLDQVEGVAMEVLDSDIPEHMEILDRQMKYWRDEIFSIQTPDRINSMIPDKKGDLHPFPSLRQRLAMAGMKRDHRKMICFNMGDGKTGASFLSKEHVGAKKMLYVCPDGTIDQMVKEGGRLDKYYKEDSKPTVAKIDSKFAENVRRKGRKEEKRLIREESMDEEAAKSARNAFELNLLKESLSCEVVFFPYSMFGAKLGGVKIVDYIKSGEVPFDFVTVDEAHLAKNEKTLNAEVVFDFVNEIPDLYENGYVCELTADPTPNTPNDIVPHLRIFDRDKYGGMSNLQACLRKVHPLELRNATQSYILLVDPPEDYESFIDDDIYTMYEAERMGYEAIVDDDFMPMNVKMKRLPLALLNPSLFSPDALPSSLVDRSVVHSRNFLLGLSEEVDEYVEGSGEDCIVIAENEVKHGFTRRHESAPDVPTFVENYEASLKAELAARGFTGELIVEVIDGGVPKAERLKMIERSKALAGTNTKMVIITMAEPVRLGIDLSHINRSILLGPAWNRPDTYQLAKRFRRELNEDARMVRMVASDTMAMGKFEHSAYKAEWNHHFKHGGALTRSQAGYFSRDNDPRTNVHMFGQKLLIGTAIVDSILKNSHKLHRLFTYLHGKGEEAYRQFIEYYGRVFMELYVENWEKSYSGNNARFVAGLMESLEDSDIVEAGPDAGRGIVYGDIACGPMVLERTLGSQVTPNRRQIFSYDLNPYLIDEGKRYIDSVRGDGASDQLVSATCSMSNSDEMKKTIADGQLDAVNWSLALHYTSSNVQRTTNKLKDDRVQSLYQMNRILREGGILAITLPSNVGSSDERQKFQDALTHFGFEVVPEFTGIGESTDDDATSIFTNYTVVCRKVKSLGDRPVFKALNMKDLKLTRCKQVVKSGPSEKRRPKAAADNPSEGALHTEFKIGSVDIEFSNGIQDAKDAEVLKREDVRVARKFLQSSYSQFADKFGDSIPDAFRLECFRKGIFITKLQAGGEKSDWIFTLKDHQGFFRIFEDDSLSDS